MNQKKLNQRNVRERESIRFYPEEIERLQAVLEDIRNQSADGKIDKVYFYKTLMGLEGYELKSLRQEHRAYLAGAINALHGPFPPVSKVARKKAGSASD